MHAAAGGLQADFDFVNLLRTVRNSEKVLRGVELIVIDLGI